MPDARFFRRAGPFPLGAIARHVGAEEPAAAAAALAIHDIAALDLAQPGEISVFNDMRYAAALCGTAASAVISSRDLARHAPAGMPLLLVANPRLAYAETGHLFYPPPALEPGIDPAARIHAAAAIGAGTQIDAGAVVGLGAEIGERCHIAFNAVIGEGVRLGADCRIGANTAISHALIGKRVGIETCVTIGGQGFGFVPGPHGLRRMLQLGRVVIEDDVQIGANCAIDRGATGDTVIGAGTVLDNLVHIGHNVRLGRRCIICGQVGIAGSSVIGDGVMMGGQVGIADHLTVGAGAQIAAKSGVMRDVEPGAVMGGFPALPVKHWHRQTLGLARLFAHGGETARDRTGGRRPSRDGGTGAD